jgi:hypothetical protein
LRASRLLGPGLVVGASILAGALLVSLLHWDPRPTSDRSFDRRTNGLWLGHRWFTGVGVRSAEPVSDRELDALVDTLAQRGIRYAYVHVGPVREDGRIEDAPGPVLGELARRAPDVVLLAWLGARVDRIPLARESFRKGLLETIASLREAGFAGVHFDFEPLHDAHPGYLEALEAVRETFGTGFAISQATPRAGPYGVSVGPLRGSFWSEAFYRATMARSDQTVVMAYDTGLGFTKGYVAFVRHQTEHLVRWACETPGHELLIGIPSYEDVPTYSDPEVENLRTASLGVRAALEAIEPPPACFAGVAVYAYWVTDDAEWRDFDAHWTAPPDARPAR